MDIDIRCTPHSQSALIQLAIIGDFDLKQNYTTYPRGIYYYWYHDIYVTITENGFAPNSGKQKMFYRSKIKPDGTGAINTIFDFPVYPLHPGTQYTINVRIVLTDTGDTTEEFAANYNFSTLPEQGAGIIKTRYTDELTLPEKQKNAIYLHNKLVKTNIYTLESFCCLLAVSEIAGNLNPAAYAIYKSFEYENPGRNEYINADDSYIYFGLYEWDNPPPPYGGRVQDRDYRMYIPQNGINSQSVDYLGGFHVVYVPSYIGRNYYALASSWYYWDNYVYYASQPYIGHAFPEDYKKQIAFGFFPNQKYLNSADIINRAKQNSWLNLDYFVNIYKNYKSSPPSGMWATAFPEYVDDTYKQLLQTYNTFSKFTRCKNTDIKKISYFMGMCFGYSGAGNVRPWGTLAVNTIQMEITAPDVKRLYNIDDLPERAEYWYNFFRKKHPWWPYLRWTM